MDKTERKKESVFYFLLYLNGVKVIPQLRKKSQHYFY